MEHSMFWSDLQNRASHPNQEVREVTLPWDLTLIGWKRFQPNVIWDLYLTMIHTNVSKGKCPVD